MLQQTANWDYQWGQIVGRAWADDAFTRRLLADPVAVLQEYDLDPPAGARIEVLQSPDQVPEGSDGVLHLVLPNRPSDEELCEDDLHSGAPVGNDRCGCGGCHGCGGCGGCGGCVACVWCLHTPEPGAN